jgi:hypothetical protein
LVERIEPQRRRNGHGESLRTMQRLARIALASEQGQPAEVLADIQRRALNGIMVVTQKAMAKALQPDQRDLNGGKQTSGENCSLRNRSHGKGILRSPGA